MSPEGFDYHLNRFKVFETRYRSWDDRGQLNAVTLIGRVTRRKFNKKYVVFHVGAHHYDFWGERVEFEIPCYGYFDIKRVMEPRLMEGDLLFLEGLLQENYGRVGVRVRRFLSQGPKWVSEGFDAFMDIHKDEIDDGLRRWMVKQGHEEGGGRSEVLDEQADEG